MDENAVQHLLPLYTSILSLLIQIPNGKILISEFMHLNSKILISELCTIAAVYFSGPVNLNVFGAFVSRTETEAEITKSDDLPFGNLLRQAEKTQHVDANANKQVAAPADEEMPTRNGDLSNGHGATNSDMTSSRESGASKSSASQASGTEDFVMVELVSGWTVLVHVELCLMS